VPVTHREQADSTSNRGLAGGRSDPTYDAFGVFGPLLESLHGKRQSFSGERSQKLQTHRSRGR
jgi:hypothetical protein